MTRLTIHHGLSSGLAGVGFKPQHFDAIHAGCEGVGLLEVHAENYMSDGGLPRRQLFALRERYPLSIHGVGLSLGGAGDLDRGHLKRLARLVSDFEPGWVSEHLAWTSTGNAYLDDLLPIPYTSESLSVVIDHVNQAQDALGRALLVENPSTYLRFGESILEEPQFLAELTRATGCGLLLDVNNVHVSAVNHQADAAAYLAAFPMHKVGEIHLAGHARHRDPGGVELLIDSHDRPVCEAVWALYREVLAQTGPVPTIIERDADIPPWAELLAEVRRADVCLQIARMTEHEIAC